MAVECYVEDSVIDSFRSNLKEAKGGNRDAAEKLMTDINIWNNSGDSCRDQQTPIVADALGNDGFEIVDQHGGEYEGRVHGDQPFLQLNEATQRVIDRVRAK